MMARWFIIAGIILIVIGLLLYFAPSLFSWFGKLPGDIRIEKEHTKIFIPVTSMILISIILTILINLIWFLRK
jgi:H+/Cl- antiporter ClcA